MNPKTYRTRHQCGAVITATITPNPEYDNGEAVEFSQLKGKLYGNYALPVSMPCQHCGKALVGPWDKWEAAA